MTPNRIAVEEGLSCFTCGWRLFIAAPAVWLAMLLIYMVVVAIVSQVPLLGPLSIVITSPAIFSGLLLAAKSADEGNTPAIEQMFHGFADQERTKPLLLLGTIFLAAQLVLLLISVPFAMGTLLALHAGDMEQMRHAFGTTGLIGFIIISSIWLVIFMGFLYSGPLVLLCGQKPLDAISSSFQACRTNILPLMVALLTLTILGALACLPMGLGWLPLLPVTVGAAYCSYKRIFQC